MGRGKRGRARRGRNRGRGMAKGLFKKMGLQDLMKPAPGRRRAPGSSPTPRVGTPNNRKFDGLVNRARTLKTRVGKRKNVATSDYDVFPPGRGRQRGQIDTVSGRGNQEKKGFTPIDRSGDDRLPNYKTDNHDRSFDSEKKIYEDFSRRFPDTRTSGRITIYTERHPCDGCSMSTQDFLRRYPNMKVDIVYTYKDVDGGAPTIGTQNKFPGDYVNDRITTHHYTRGAR
ncbi:deaminase domain-containing protein [Actinomadura chokoriensis]|uniref:deaminase domain-containing protein n=1 Tax=Actinomadura chokoriensis TaxID=454156 RepID=UPI0031F7D302